MRTRTLHFRAVSISRTRGDSAVAACAYRSGQDLYDEKHERLHRYGNRRGVLETGLFLPEHAPDWMRGDSPRDVWQRLANEIERKEDGHNRRATAELLKDFQAAAPRELSQEQNWALARSFVKTLNDKGLVVAAAFHEGEASDGGTNPHFHFAVPLRGLDENGFGKKYRGLSGTWMVGRENPEFMELRRDYYQCVNDALSSAGVEGVRYDPEKQQDREPGIHKGKEAAALERKGERSRLSEHNRRVAFSNHVRPYDRALSHTETLPAWEPSDTEECERRRRIADLQLLRTAAMAARDATQKNQSSVLQAGAARTEKATEGARRAAILAHRQSESYQQTHQQRVSESREEGPDRSR